MSLKCNTTQNIGHFIYTNQHFVQCFIPKYVAPQTLTQHKYISFANSECAYKANSERLWISQDTTIFSLQNKFSSLHPTFPVNTEGEWPIMSVFLER